MYYVEKQTPNVGGIYLILDLMDARAYVGKAGEFSSRDHRSELKAGADNAGLQAAYDRGADLIYFQLLYDTPDRRIGDKLLLRYEKLYMTLVEDTGLTLFNSGEQPLPEHRTWEVLSAMDFPFTVEEARAELDRDFLRRFGMTPRSVVQADRETRAAALAGYLARREEFHSQVYYFDQAGTAERFRLRRYSLAELEPDELIYSEAGAYVGDTIEDILQYEIAAIEAHGYCLWTFARQAINTQAGRDLCRRRAAQGKPTFVLFHYTASMTHAASDDRVAFRRFAGEDLARLTPGERALLLPEGGDAIPPDMDATGKPSAGHALVIQEFGLLRESFDSRGFLACYDRVNKYGDLSDAAKSMPFPQRSGYLRRKGDPVLRETDRTDYFVGRLAPPYLVDLAR